ncbi:MAG: GNAT family N-acetyltransferase [Clostridia bacterium]|nr:GNAT family N-acetyltransferase [Clostridia bacterium]
MSGLREISFRKINREEFEIFEKWSIKNYAENLIKSGDEKFLFKAKRAAKSEFKDVFPSGADTENNFLYVVLNEKGEGVGVIGYQKSPFEENAAFVIENVIKEEFRGMGYGKAPLLSCRRMQRKTATQKWCSMRSGTVKFHSECMKETALKPLKITAAAL